MALTQDDNFDDISDHTNSILHFQGVVTGVVNSSVRHGQFGEFASALDLDPICDLHLVVTKVPGADWRRPANDGQVQLQSLPSQDIDYLLRYAGNVHPWHHWTGK